MAASRSAWWPVLVGAGVAVAFVYGGRTILVRTAAADEARLRALEARVTSLEARLRRTHAFGDAPAAATAHLVIPTAPAEAESAPAPAEAAPPPPALKTVAVDEAALERSYFSEIDARLAGETRDPVWAAPTEELLRGAARDVQPRLTVDSAQCGQTICRVETTADPAETARAVRRFLVATGPLMPEAVVRDGDGPGHHVVYFGRNLGVFPAMTAEPEAAR